MSDSQASTRVRRDSAEPRHKPLNSTGGSAGAGALAQTLKVRPRASEGLRRPLGKLWPASTVTAIEAAEEATYWRDHYRSRPYAGPGANHDDFGPAYAYALLAYRRHAGRPFDSLVNTLAAQWPAHRERSSLDWARACPAVRDAWDRLHAR